MNLLAIETATSVCSVALWQDGEVTVELTLNRPRAHAENLVPMLSDALRYGGLKASDVDVLAVSAGPGSYTGLRIGVSTAKGLAAAVDAKLVAVPSLEALAFGSRYALSEGDVMVAAFDARRDEVFAAAFAASTNGRLDEVRRTDAILVGEAAEWLGNVEGNVLLAGDGAAKLHVALTGLDFDVMRLPQMDVFPSAGAVARLGAERLSSGDTADVASFEPHYLKEFVARKPATTAFEKLPF